MKRQIVITFLAIVTAVVTMLSCSNPLEITTEPQPIDPINTIDTDTLYITDTVYITLPDNGSSPWVCARLNSARQDIVWMFHNDPGRYRLEFTAALEKEHPSHTLSVEIDGNEIEWDLSESLELTFDQDLEQNTTFRIRPSKPPSFGHAIDICLTVTAM